MGSPQNPTTTQIAMLAKAGQLETMGSPKRIIVDSGKMEINIELPRQAVSFLKLDW